MCRQVNVPAGFLAAGMVTPGALIDEAASFTAFGVSVDRFIPDTKYNTLEIIPLSIPGYTF